jgi:F-box/leucine-rich repeat protein 2/20
VGRTSLCALMTSWIATCLAHGTLPPRSSWETVDVHTAWRKVTVECVRGIIAVRGTIITSFVLDQCFGIKDEVLALIAQDCPNLTRLSLVGCWCVWDTTRCIGVSGMHASLELHAVVNLTYMLLPSQGCDRPGHQARRRAPASPKAHQPQQVRSSALVHGDPPCIQALLSSLTYERRTLPCCSCRKLTDLAVVALANHCIELQTIQLEYCKNLTDTSLAYILARCRLLRTLNLKRCTGISNSMSDRAAPCIGQRAVRVQTSSRTSTVSGCCQDRLSKYIDSHMHCR